MMNDELKQGDLHSSVIIHRSSFFARQGGQRQGNAHGHEAGHLFRHYQPVFPATQQRPPTERSFPTARVRKDRLFRLYLQN